MSFGQQLERVAISEGGNTIGNTQVELSVTIGEPAVKNHDAPSVFLSEGVEQGRELFNLSVIHLEEASIRVYPNPASDQIVVTSDMVVDQITIMNSAGQEVLAVEINSTQKIIQLKHLPGGLYYIRIGTSGYQTISKFIKI
ncbi:MAG: T9SS type A sorting domain-containing protein [Bacteroidia bacterium]|nr:T9SS type A sorting domain-containing protein [Bacteroidia bacterium]